MARYLDSGYNIDKYAVFHENEGQKYLSYSFAESSETASDNDDEEEHFIEG